jgi:hypothetical protein
MVASAKAKVLKEPSDRESPAMLDLVGRPVKKGSMLILRKNRPVQQI